LSEEKSDAQQIASGNDAFTLLEYQATFKNFINELYEVCLTTIVRQFI
jgi:hypothetical protein